MLYLLPYSQFRNHKKKSLHNPKFLLKIVRYVVVSMYGLDVLLYVTSVCE